MRYIAQCSLIALALAWVSPAAAGELEFHGYIRAGMGLATTGGPGVCYGLSGADSKFRLGNECDYVIEPIFTYHVAKLEDGSDWGLRIQSGIYRTWQGLPAGSSDAQDVTGFSNLPVQFQEVYVFGAGVPQLAMGKVWAGRRQYARLLTGINDMFQQNEDGDGAGVEDMQLGPVKLSVALLLDPNTNASSTDEHPNGEPTTDRVPTIKPFKFEMHAFIPTVEKGELQIWYTNNNYSKTVNESLGEDPPDVFVGQPARNDIGIYHKLGGVLNGELLVGGKLMMNSLTQTYRIILQQGMGFPEFRTNVDALVYYRSSKGRADADADWGDPTNELSAGFRTDTGISGPFRFMLEYGHNRVEDTTDGAINSSLNKLTGALAINAGPEAWSRPSVRLYYTQAWWNEGAGPGTNQVYGHWQAGQLVRNAYGNQTAGGTFGLQGEVWW